MRTIVALCLACLPGLTLAQQIFKCEADGQPPIYQNEPCPSGTKSTTAAHYSKQAPAPAAQPNVRGAMDREAVQRMCAAMHPDSYSIQSGCLRNNQRGFDELQALGSSSAEGTPQHAIVLRCAQQHWQEEFNVVDYSIAAGCMRNELRGLKEMTQ